MNAIWEEGGMLANEAGQIDEGCSWHPRKKLGPQGLVFDPDGNCAGLEGDNG